MKNLPEKNTFPVKKTYGLKSVAFMIISLLLISYGLIGGCNNDSGSGQSQKADALVIGSLDGVIVPALNDVAVLKKWSQGDADNNFILNGNRVNQLTSNQKAALNSAYQAGFFVALVEPDLNDIEALHDVLGLDQLVNDGLVRDLFAISRSSRPGGGISYYHLIAADDHGMPDAGLQLELAQTLFDFQDPLGATGASPTPMPTTTCPDPSNLLCLVYGINHQIHFQIHPGQEIFEVFGNKILQDFGEKFIVNISTQSMHSIDENLDYYAVSIGYNLTPYTTLPLDNGTTWPCYNIPDPDLSKDEDDRGVSSYIFNHNETSFPNDVDVNLVNQSPASTECENTYTSSVSREFGGSVSYSSEEGGGVEVSSDISYENGVETSCPPIQILNTSGNDVTTLSNAEWTFDVFNTSAAVGAFNAPVQWIWSASPATRAKGQLEFELQVIVNYFPVSCTWQVGPTYIPLQETHQANVIMPIPPTPPPPTPTPTPTPTPPPCTMNSDCPVGQECATDLNPAICVPQPCDEMMTCPLGFECVNEVCKPES